MSRPTAAPQQGKSFGYEAKVALLRNGTSITYLARQMKRPRSSVSKAINQDRFPHLRKLIAARLHL